MDGYMDFLRAALAALFEGVMERRQKQVTVFR